MPTLVPANDRIRIWNDHLRQFHRGGRVLLTQGITSLDERIQEKIVEAVSNFDEFTKDNDPYNQHDCAILSVEGIRIMFKIDYYDLSYTFASEDPADPRKTRRVMTIMLTEEY